MDRVELVVKVVQNNYLDINWSKVDIGSDNIVYSLYPVLKSISLFNVDESYWYNGIKEYIFDSYFKFENEKYNRVFISKFGNISLEKNYKMKIPIIINDNLNDDIWTYNISDNTIIKGTSILNSDNYLYKNNIISSFNCLLELGHLGIIQSIPIQLRNNKKFKLLLGVANKTNHGKITISIIKNDIEINNFTYDISNKLIDLVSFFYNDDMLVNDTSTVTIH